MGFSGLRTRWSAIVPGLSSNRTSDFVIPDLIHGKAAPGCDLIERDSPVRILPEVFARGRDGTLIFFGEWLAVRLYHDLEKLQDGRDPIGVELVKQLMGVLLRLRACRRLSYFFNSSISAAGPLVLYISVSRCSSAEGGSAPRNAGSSRSRRLEAHTLPSENCTWLMNPVMLWIFNGRPLRERSSVLSCRTCAVPRAGKSRLGPNAGSDAARYCSPVTSRTSQPNSTYFTGLPEQFLNLYARRAHLVARHLRPAAYRGHRRIGELHKRELLLALRPQRRRGHCRPTRHAPLQLRTQPLPIHAGEDLFLQPFRSRFRQHLPEILAVALRLNLPSR